MARIVDYDTVLQTLLGQGLKSLYYNSGAFGFPPGVVTQTLGLIGPEDPTIRPEALPFTRRVEPPFESTLAEFTLRIWRDHLPGPVWAMPRSHWAYELDFGSRDWMPGALAQVGVDAQTLELRTTGDAVEFLPDQADEFGGFLTALLGHLTGSSDFQLAWPGRAVVCTVHHHKQLWWTIADPTLHSILAELA